MTQTSALHTELMFRFPMRFCIDVKSQRSILGAVDPASASVFVPVFARCSSTDWGISSVFRESSLGTAFTF